MGFSVREAKKEDYIAIARLNKEEMKYDYPVEKTKVKLAQILEDASQKVYVAVSSEQVIGYVHVNNYDVLYAPHMKNIMGIAVEQNFKKQGVGRALLEVVEKWGKETGASGVRLVSGSERKEAHAFYKHCNYIESKEQKNFKKLFNHERS